MDSMAFLIEDGACLPAAMHQADLKGGLTWDHEGRPIPACEGKLLDAADPRANMKACSHSTPAGKNLMIALSIVCSQTSCKAAAVLTSSAGLPHSSNCIQNRVIPWSGWIKHARGIFKRMEGANTMHSSRECRIDIPRRLRAYFSCCERDGLVQHCCDLHNQKSVHSRMVAECSNHDIVRTSHRMQCTFLRDMKVLGQCSYICWGSVSTKWYGNGAAAEIVISSMYILISSPYILFM